LTVYRLPACIFNSLEATLVHYWFNPEAEGVFAMNKHESVLLQMQRCGTGGKNMAELGPKNKNKVSAKSLANLRPNPQNMRHVGGSKRREYVTNQELELLNNLLDGATHRDAARGPAYPRASTSPPCCSGR